MILGIGHSSYSEVLLYWGISRCNCLFFSFPGFLGSKYTRYTIQPSNDIIFPSCTHSSVSSGHRFRGECIRYGLAINASDNNCGWIFLQGLGISLVGGASCMVWLGISGCFCPSTISKKGGTWSRVWMGSCQQLQGAKEPIIDIMIWQVVTYSLSLVDIWAVWRLRAS